MLQADLGKCVLPECAISCVQSSEAASIGAQIDEDALLGDVPRQ